MQNYHIKYSGEFSEDIQSLYGDSCWYLVEIDRIILKEKVIWSDIMEPEDAILPRDLRELVEFLEKKLNVSTICYQN